MQDKEKTLEKIKKLTEAESFYKAILSNPIKNKDSITKKIIITIFSSKNKKFLQFESFIDTKVIHKNIKFTSDIFSQILNLMQENFKQCVIYTKTCSFTILMNKSKSFKITGIKKLSKLENTLDLSHNKVKNYVLKEGHFYDWLHHLGVIDKNGNVLQKKRKKFNQINKFLEMLDTVEQYLPQNANIIDMGCGKSYLTFAIYYYFNEIKKKSVNIKGFDLKKDVIEDCNNLAKKVNFYNLQFFNKDISTLKNSKESIHMLISLHACDTATDYAIFYGVKYNCKVILSVPCCQNEIFSQIDNKKLNIILKHGILKERFSAILTDAIRAETLRICGYKTSVLEFIDTEHTPKNIMIRAVKKEKFTYNEQNEQKIINYESLINDFNLNPKIYGLLKNSF